MRETRIILIVIIALVFIVGIYYGLSSNLTTPANNTTNTTNNTTQNQTNSTQNQTNNTSYTSNSSTSNSNNNQQSSVSNSNSKKSSSSSSDNGAVSEEWKENYQAGDGSYYREVDYKDGGMRQYDKNGKLIGSTYDSDQDQLPSME